MHALGAGSERSGTSLSAGGHGAILGRPRHVGREDPGAGRSAGTDQPVELTRSAEGAMGMVRRGLLVVALVALAMAPPVRAQQAEKRIAFVVGDAAYQAAPLQTPANDAGLIAQTLQTAGFEVVGARDLDQAAFVNAWNDFLAKTQDAGPDAVAFVYLAGYGLQFNGENYYASIDAQIAASSDIASNAIKLSDMSASLASVPLKARIFVLDAARANPFALNDPSIA